MMRVRKGRQSETAVRTLEQRGAAGLARVEKQVARIVAEVRRNKDRALRRFAEKWDGLGEGQPLRVAEEELEAAWQAAPDNFKQALNTAAANIRKYCEWQRPQPWRNSVAPGIQTGQVVRPL